MTTEDFISELFYGVDEAMEASQPSPGELVAELDCDARHSLCPQRRGESGVLPLAES